MRYPILRLNDGFKHTSPTLRSEVKTMQRELKKRGYSLKVDGLFGPETEEIVRAFQKNNNLDDDGVAGPFFWEKILSYDPPLSGYPFQTTYARDNKDLLAQLEQTRFYRDHISDACRQYGFQESVIAGIGSRESRWGMALTPTGPTGTGDFIERSSNPPLRPGGLPPDGGGFGRGLMQIDWDAHKFAQGELWKNARENIFYGAKVLQEAINYLQENSDYQELNLLRAAVAAYNCGSGRVLRAIIDKRDIDYYTTGHDYSKNVFNRAGWFQLKGWE